MVRLGDGAGGLASGKPFETGLGGTNAAEAGDLNGDGADDLVLTRLDADGAADILVSSESAPRLSWIRNRREGLTTTRCSPLKNSDPAATQSRGRRALLRGPLFLNGLLA